MELKNKKLLVLAGKPIGSCEIVDYAKSKEVYTIVTDYLKKSQSAAKKICDEIWDISTADIEQLKERIIKEDVDGIYTGVHEFNIGKMIELCRDLGLPCFCTLEQWEYLNNKRCFKNLCKKYDIPVTNEYQLTDIVEDQLSNIEFPVIIKPVDGSGSRGFAVCYNKEELINAYPKAKEFSASGKVLVEKYMRYEYSAIINYTLLNGEIYFNGISDKQSKKVFNNGAPIMSVQFYPSLYEQEYLQNLDKKVKNMFKDFGLKNGVIWIEAFCDKGVFTFNEMGYRFGGSLTYLPVQYLYGTDQLGIQIEYALKGKNEDCKEIKEQRITDETYCILPVHVKPGIISQVIGFEALKKNAHVNRVVPVHFLGDKIEAWGSAQQVFAYLHITAKNRNDLESIITDILNTLSIKDENGKEILFNLYREGH